MKKTFLTIGLSLIISGCATNPEQVVENTPPRLQRLQNDYPTRDRVEYVLNCVAQHVV